MTPPRDGSSHLRPLPWMLPLGAVLLALAAWAGPPEAGVGVGTDEVPAASGRTSAAIEADADGPLAPELLRETESATEAEGEGLGHVAAAAVRDERPRGPDRTPTTAPAVPSPPLPPFARHGTLTLLTPATEPVLVGFHEAGTRDGLELEPVGVLIENNNTTRISAPDDDPAGSPYRILHSRGRRAQATSAVDIAMRDDEPVLAPVDGTVTDVREYHLDGRYRDLRVEIQPELAPDLRVVIIHLDRLTVIEGDEVRAGRTVLAETARRFPFASQIDYVIEDERWPHVHLEVKRAEATRPGDG